MTTTQTPETTDTFIIAPAGGEFAVTNRRTGEFLGYFLTRLAANRAVYFAERAITDKAQRQLSSLRKQMESTGRVIAGYQAMLEIAEASGMEHEMERIPQQIDECEQHLADLRDEAVAAGFGPEDFS